MIQLYGSCIQLGWIRIARVELGETVSEFGTIRQHDRIHVWLQCSRHAGSRFQVRHRQAGHLGLTELESLISAQKECPIADNQSSAAPKLFCRNGGFASRLRFANQSAASSLSFLKNSYTVPWSKFVPDRDVI